MFLRCRQRRKREGKLSCAAPFKSSCITFLTSHWYSRSLEWAQVEGIVKLHGKKYGYRKGWRTGLCFWCIIPFFPWNSLSGKDLSYIYIKLQSWFWAKLTLQLPWLSALSIWKKHRRKGMRLWVESWWPQILHHFPNWRRFCSSIPLNLVRAGSCMIPRTQWKWPIVHPWSSPSEVWQLLCAPSWKVHSREVLSQITVALR